MEGELKMVECVPGVPAREVAGHKGTFGTVIVVAGSETMIGAPALVAAGAVRSGAGLVKLVLPRGIVQAVLTVEPGVTAVDWWNGESATLVRDDDVIDAGRLTAALARVDARTRAVLAVGPGMGVTEASGEVVRAVLGGARAVVLDADGLSALAAGAATGGAVRREKPWVMTPHPGEFVRLAAAYGLPAELSSTGAATDAAVRPRAAAALARASGAVVVLKGHRTVVSDGSHVYTNTTGNPAMATGGTGDVLTGTIAALLAQGMSAIDAAILGTFLHGLAGDLWAATNGISGLSARDLAVMLPAAFQKHRSRG